MRIRRLLDSSATVLIAALLGAGLAIIWTGGGRLVIAGVEISARNPSRPLILAAIVTLLWAVPRLVRGGSAIPETIRRLANLAMAGLAIAGLAVIASGIVYACGGLDSHGYVASSRLFSEGRVRRTLPDLSWLPFERPAEAAAPLGFWPAPDGGSVVPEFPPGLPLVMAAARLAFGADAVFVVSFLALIVLASVVGAIARQRYGAPAAPLAGVLVVAHPVAAAYAMQAMSDVPAAMWTAIAVWALAHPTRVRPFVAGASGALAVLTRPPLLLPMVVLAVSCARRGPRAAVIFSAIVLAGVIGLMALQFQLYGNPLVSGHGGAGQIFTLATFPHNLTVHAKWFLVVQTPLIVPLLWLGYRSDRASGALLMALAAAVALPYLFYAVPFDDWEMQRFLLPGLALLWPVAAEGISVILRRLSSSEIWRHVAAVGIAATVLVGSGRWLESKGVFSLPVQEAKYPRVGAWFTDRTPENTIVFTSLHSGSVNYYSGRQTLRWDFIPQGRFAAAVRAAHDRGYLTYLVLDGTHERDLFARLHGDANPGIDVQPIDRILSAEIAEIRPAPARR